MKSLCTRSVDFTPVEGGNDSDGHTLEGYGAVFEDPTRINSWEGKFDERIAPGAFRKTLSERKPVMQFDHGRDARTGSVPIAAIDEIREDGQGLYVKARMFDNPVVEPIRQAIQGGAIKGMSFRFNVVRDEWRDARGLPVRPEELQRLLYEPGERGPLQRTLKEVQLFEVGPVVNPAYPGTSVGVRSLSDDEQASLIAEYQRSMTDPEDVPGPAGPATPNPLPGDKAVPEVRDETDPQDIDGPSGPPVPSPIPGDKTTGDRAAMETPKSPYGVGIPYADPGYQADHKKRYPLNNAEHAKAAWDFINESANAAQYTAGQVASMKSKIKAACKKFGITVSESKSSDIDAATRGTSDSGNTTTPATSVTSSGHDTTTDRKAVPMRKSIDELRARLDEISERLMELGSDETRSLDDTEQTEFDTLDAESREIEVAITKIEERTERLRVLATRTPAAVERGSDRAPAFHREVEDIYDFDAIRSASSSDEDYKKRRTDNALRAIEAANYGADVDKQAAQTHVDKLLRNVDNKNGDLANRLLATGTPAYERAFGKLLMKGANAFLTGEERQAIERAMSNSPDADGGYAVPFQLDPTVVLDNAGTINPIRQLARQVQIVGKQWNGVTSTGVSVTRGAEASTAPDSSFTLAQPTLTTNTVQGFVPFSIQIDLEWNALRSEIAALLLDAKAREEDSFFTGSGSGSAPFGVVATATATTATTASAAFSPQDLYDLEVALAPRWRSKGQFIANKAILNKIRQFDQAGGSQLWQRVGAGLPPELLGYPVHEVSAMASALTTGTTIMMFGDFSNFLIVDRIGMNMELVPLIFDASNSNRPTGQRGVYAYWMNNSKIILQDGFQSLVTS